MTKVEKLENEIKTKINLTPVLPKKPTKKFDSDEFMRLAKKVGNILKREEKRQNGARSSVGL